MEWIVQHWAEIGLVLMAVIRAAEAIAAMTPTEKDDIIVAKIKAIVKRFFSFGAGK